VLAGLVQFDEVGFLARVELGLLAAQAALGLGDAHAFACSQSDEVGFELRDHGQDVEQQPPHGVGRVVDRAAEAELDVARGETLQDFARVG
jgi:hypothetical protein